MTERTLNHSLPGSQRYKSKEMTAIFGYDQLYIPCIEVELAALDTLADLGVIPESDYALLNDDCRAKLLAITTTEVDEIERSVTHHDVRAIVIAMQAIIPEPLRRWLHVPLTSYDVLDTARAIQFMRAYQRVIAPKLKRVISILAGRIVEHAETLQIGRTHGQHAIPITVGFWLATILSRLIDNATALKTATDNLVGKITGPVGAYNAQVALGLYQHANSSGLTFEQLVLGRLGLKAARVSTQILPPETIARYLYACFQVIATLGQLGTDFRQLARTEIGEVREPFEKRQVGSSAMGHKRNPIASEGEVGAWVNTVGEFVKVLLTSISEHQRDLTGSSVLRDSPMVPLLLVRQLDPLLRRGKDDKRPYLERIIIDTVACRRNFLMSAHLVLAEPLYLAMQFHGFTGDAHELVNHGLVEIAAASCKNLVDVLEDRAKTGEEPFASAFAFLPDKVKNDLRHPERYIGRAPEIARETAGRAMALVETL
jgi:adenylosuccinate lyase